VNKITGMKPYLLPSIIDEMVHIIENMTKTLANAKNRNQKLTLEDFKSTIA